MGNIKINLFDLINEEEKRIRCWIMAKGENLNEYLKLLIEKSTIVMGTKKELTRYFQNKFNISRSVSERFVFLMKEWHPLILMKELTTLTNTSYLEIQEYIDFLKLNQPPVKIYRAVKELSKDLCKIAGAHAADGTMNKNFFSITDGYKSDILAFNKWLKNTFGVEYDMKKISDNEWGINFHSSVICTYLREIFNFPSGIKVYGVSEPQIIKNAPINFRKNFALGALTFEAGVGMRNQVELCVFSKAFRDSIAEILSLLKIKFTNMENQSNGYWRLWSNKLSREDAKKWMELFEPKTEKWFKLNDYLCGFQGKVNSFEEASEILNKVYPSKEASKICLKDILMAIKELKKTYRYELVSFLCKEKNLGSYGGKWAHSLSPHLNVLRKARIIQVEKQEFGKKKSFGSIVREIYIYNPNINEWNIPLRP